MQASKTSFARGGSAVDRADHLAVGIRDMLRLEYPLRNEECENRPDGRPPANSGQLYVAVFPLGLSQGPSPDQQLGVDEIHSIGIGITQRTGLVPDDRMFRHAVYHEKGAYTVFQRIHRLFRRKRVRVDMLSDINQAMQTDEEVLGVFIEPLDLVADTYQFVVKEHDWFLSEPPDLDHATNCQDHGIYVEMQFSGARYFENLIGV